MPPTPTPTPSSTSTSAPITPSGGSVATTLGAQTLTVAVPAGAFASSGTIKITLENVSGVTSTFAKARAALRSAQSVPSGAVPLAAFVVDAGGAMLKQPLQVSLSGIPAAASGQSVLLSGYSSSAFADVATTTYANQIYSETTDPHYPGVTLASPTLYVLYSVATASVATPTATITVSGPATVSPGLQATYTAAEATSNGFPFIGHSFTYAVSSASLGSINSSTGVLAGAPTGGLGSVNATDSAVATFSGTLSVADTTARPGVTGLSEQYAGTLTEVDTNYAIATPAPVTTASPAPATTSAPATLTTSAKTTLNITAAADAADTTASATAVTFTANESDVSTLSTTSSTTTSTVLYQPQASGTVDVRLAKTVAAESSGVTYEYDFGSTNGLVSILPETAQTFTNDASEVYLETDPGLGVTSTGQQVTTDKTVSANGNYSANYQELNVYNGAPATDVATENVDFSGTLALNSIDPNAFVIQFAAPASGSITTTFIDPNTGLDSPATFPSYIPASIVQPSTETDTITPAQQLAASCTNAATYPTATTVTQQQTIVDSIFGTVETRTFTSYDVNGVGTVCTTLSDTVNIYYDYSGQEGPYTLVYDANPSVPLLATTTSETLSLTSTNAAQVQSVRRTAQSVGAAVPTLPLALVAAHIEHVTQQRALRRLATFRQNASLKLHGGSAK